MMNNTGEINDDLLLFYGLCFGCTVNEGRVTSLSPIIKFTFALPILACPTRDIYGAQLLTGPRP